MHFPRRDESRIQDLDLEALERRKERRLFDRDEIISPQEVESIEEWFRIIDSIGRLDFAVLKCAAAHKTLYPERFGNLPQFSSRERIKSTFRELEHFRAGFDIEGREALNEYLADFFIIGGYFPDNPISNEIIQTVAHEADEEQKDFQYTPRINPEYRRQLAETLYFSYAVLLMNGGGITAGHKELRPFIERDSKLLMTAIHSFRVLDQDKYHINAPLLLFHLRALFPDIYERITSDPTFKTLEEFIAPYIKTIPGNLRGSPSRMELAAALHALSADEIRVSPKGLELIFRTPGEKPHKIPPVPIVRNF